jgi:hypothetical protein
VWENAYNYKEHTEPTRRDFGPRNGAENISDIDGCFEFFLNKQITQQIVRDNYRNAEKYKTV